MPHQEDEDDVGLLAEEGRGASRRTTSSGTFLGSGGLCACFSVEYYQPYFDVNTDEVISRIKYALMFCGEGAPFLEVVREKPDAYGPWWIATTLIFLMSVTSQLKAAYNGHGFDFAIVSFAAMAVYSYVGMTAIAMWVCLNYWLKTPLTVVQCACIVGYSLSVYVIASLFCFVNHLGWPVLLAAWILSSLFAIKSILPVIEHLEKQHVAIFFGGLVVINAVLMIMLKSHLYSEAN